MTGKLIDIISAQCSLGEGIQWNVEDQAVWWTDINRKQLWRHHPGSGQTQTVALPERLGAFAFTAREGLLLAAFASGFAFFDLASRTPYWLHRPEAGHGGRRFNDGRVDRQGRFWVGTMVEDAAKAGDRQGALYCLDRDGGLSQHLGGIGISNSICWAPDGGTFYFADTPTRTIRAWDFDREAGRLQAERVFARTPDGAFPDGSAIDAEGCLWNAQWGAGQVVRYRPDGSIDWVLAVPAPQPTCVAFGGPNLDQLYVSTARVGLDRQTLRAAPCAGDVFVYQLDVAGLPESRYQGRLPTLGG